MYTAWSGYFTDHTFEADETGMTYGEARFSVLDALDNEREIYGHEADCAETDADRHEWLKWAAAYQGALEIVSLLADGDTFDVTIRGERFAIVPDSDAIADALEAIEIGQTSMEELHEILSRTG